MKKYHTALKESVLAEKHTGESNFETHPKGLMIKNDIIRSGLPAEFDSCDVLYSDPPWPHGWHIFNKRAGVNGTTYQQLCDAITKIIKQGKPTYLCLGKSLLGKLPEPKITRDVILNGDKIILAIWNDNAWLNAAEQHRLGIGFQETLSTRDVCIMLASRYKCIGDFACGYGESVRNFLDGGGARHKFVASDYNGNCISVMSQEMLKY